MIEKMTTWIAWHLPRRLVMWCAVRVHAYATLPPYGDQVVPELLALDALKRWEDGDNIRRWFNSGRELMDSAESE